MRPVNGSATYATAAAFRRAVDARLKTARTATGRSVEELRREFLFQRFLAMVFTGGSEQDWVLKGGAGETSPFVTYRIIHTEDLDVEGELSDVVVSLTADRESLVRAGPS